ncbi:AMP-binding protein [Streptomyces cellulosae]|uniref:AMP-binding protein n=1 Tax=Streptomyces cellulosae TaxID=1968 RepID=UPI0019027E7D|nr:AMP-binding protein [Streptomyces cellulosae]
MAREPEGVTYREVDAGGVLGIWCEPVDVNTDYVLLHSHAGGPVFSSAFVDRKLAGHIAKAAGAPVLVLDFRRAPEHKYRGARTAARSSSPTFGLPSGPRIPSHLVAGDIAAVVDDVLTMRRAAGVKVALQPVSLPMASPDQVQTRPTTQRTGRTPMHRPTRNVSRVLTDSVSRYPERTAMVFGDDRITYRALDAAANRVANLLVSRGIQPGDKVALSCLNLPHFTSVYFGILKAGAAVVPLNVLLKAREVAYHLTDSDAKAYSRSRARRNCRSARPRGRGSRPRRAVPSSS